MNAIFNLDDLIIETDRLILRKWKIEDLDDFYEYACVPGVGEMAGWPHHESKEVSKKILEHFISGNKTFAIVYKENNKVIGSLGIELYKLADKLSEFDGYYGREIGYVLSKGYWGKGLMPEAVKAVIEYLFKNLNYDFLLCSYFDKNNRSKRVQEKCGFKPYRKAVFDGVNDEKEPGIINLLINPDKKLILNFSHPESLIYKN